MKKLTTVLLTGSALLLFTACGGGSSSSGSNYTPPVDPMTEKNVIVINYHTPPGECESADFQNFMMNYMANEGFVVDSYLFRETDNNVNCSTYGKTTGYTETEGCAVNDLSIQFPSYASNPTSCVIGMDVDPKKQPRSISNELNTAFSSEMNTAISTSITSW